MSRSLPGLLVLVALAVTAVSTLPAAGDVPPAIEHPERTVGPETCARCHDREFALWEGTAHAALYAGDEPLHQRPRAREIASKLGVRLIKHDSLCLDCHFTPQERGGRVTARAGVSCESCHGAARDWVTVHNTWNGRDTDRASETPAATEARVERNARAGMVFSGVLYDLVSRCYRCHTVPAPRLVEEGGHTRGGELDLLTRLEAIRHNYVRGERTANAPFPVERRRQLLLLGPLAELEIQLRAIADAETDGPYVRGKARRVETLLRTVGRHARKTPLPELDEALAATEGLLLEPSAGAELRRAADLLEGAGRRLFRAHDGTGLAALDPLLAGGDAGAVDLAEGGVPGPDPLVPTSADAEPAVAASEEGGGRATPPGSGEDQSGARPAPAPRRGPTGAISRHLRRPLSERGVVGQGRCDACHTDQNGWWYDDPHGLAAEPFYSRSRAVLQISRTYYGKPVDEALATGRVVCMDCHGTVETGAEAREVDSGPSCESCHGPAGDYLKPHPEAPRDRRLALGMVDLTDARRRAEVCAGCHYVTDPRLLASGHPSGRDFDPAARMSRIVHWGRPQPAAGALEAAWRQVTAARGPIPDVEVVGDAVPAAALAAGRDRTTSAVPVGRPRRRSASMPDLPGARPFRDGSADGVAATLPAITPRDVVLPPWPENAADRPLEELLELVRSRLERLDAALRDEDGGESR